MPGRDDDEVDDARSDQLETLRAAVLARLDRLGRDHRAIVDQVRLDMPDDEHDPDGATLAWERQQLAALIEHEQSRLRSVESALARRSEEAWGRCEDCGQPIGDERLTARPDARRCVACATRHQSGGS